MVDLIEIAKPLTRLKSTRQTQRRGTFCRRITVMGLTYTFTEDGKTSFRPECRSER